MPLGVVATEAGAAIAGGRYGIAAVGHDGGDTHINSGASAGVFAQATGAGTISIFNSATGVIQSSGNSSSPAISIVDDPTGGVILNNFGMNGRV